MEHNEKEKLKRRKIAAPSSPSSQESTNLGDKDVSHNTFVEVERPLDGKIKNKLLNKQKSKDSMSSNLMGILNKINEEKKKIHFQQQEIHRIALEKILIDGEILQMERLKQEKIIMMVDASGWSEMQQEYFHRRQVEIFENHKEMEHNEKESPERIKTATLSSSSTPKSINLGDDNVSHNTFVVLERPLDKKAKKEQLNKQKSKDITSLDIVRILNEIREEEKNMNEKNMEILEKSCFQGQEILQIKRQKLQRLHMKEELRIMMIDTSAVPQMLQEYVRQWKKEILENQKKKVVLLGKDG